jgi:hypothetical protein
VSGVGADGARLERASQDTLHMTRAGTRPPRPPACSWHGTCRRVRGHVGDHLDAFRASHLARGCGCPATLKTLRGGDIQTPGSEEAVPAASAFNAGLVCLRFHSAALPKPQQRPVHSADAAHATHLARKTPGEHLWSLRPCERDDGEDHQSRAGWIAYGVLASQRTVLCGCTICLKLGRLGPTAQLHRAWTRRQSPRRK